MTKQLIDNGFIEANCLYRNGLNNAQPVMLKSLEEDKLEAEIAFFQEQFEIVMKEFVELENRIIGTSNKGSFLAKLMNLKLVLKSHKGLGDYDGIYDKLVLYENQINDIIKSNRQRNTDIKNALILELEAEVANNDMHEAGLKIQDIKTRWIKTGSPDDGVKEELENKFKELTDQFYSKKHSFFEDKKKLLEARVNRYDEIISKLEGIIEKKNLSGQLEVVQQLQGEWKAIGHIPEGEYKSRNQRYWELCQVFFNELKQTKKSQASKQNPKSNLKLKSAVLDELKVLEGQALSEDVSERVDEAKKVWKTIGRIPKTELEESNKKFINSLNSISERSFILNLASKKFKGFAKKEGDERNKMLLKIVNELLVRDRNELKLFRENFENMQVSKGSFLDMLEKKLLNQENRVKLKEQIIKELKAQKAAN